MRTTSSRPLAPLHLGDHVPGLRVLAHRRGQDQPQPHRAARGQALEQIGIGIGERRGGNARHAVDIVRCAGVRQTMRIGAEGAMEIRHRAAPRRLRRTGAPDRIGRAIAAAVLEPHHALRHHRDLAVERAGRRREQGGIGREEHDLGIDPRRRGRDRAAQGGDGEMLRHRRQHIRRLGAADPGGERERLGVNIRVAVGAELGLGPFDRARMRLGAGQALPDLGGEGFERGEGAPVVERGLGEARGGLRRGGLGGAVERGAAGQRQRQAGRSEGGHRRHSMPRRAAPAMASLRTIGPEG